MGDVIQVNFEKGIATPLPDELIVVMIEQAKREDKSPDCLLLTDKLNEFLLDAGVSKDRPLYFMMGYIDDEEVSPVEFKGDGYNDVFNEYLSRLMDGDIELYLMVVQPDRYRSVH